MLPSFFDDLLSCRDSKQVLPDAKNYLPKLRETSVNANEVNLAADPNRRGKV